MSLSSTTVDVDTIVRCASVAAIILLVVGFWTMFVLEFVKRRRQNLISKSLADSGVAVGIAAAVHFVAGIVLGSLL